MRNGMHLLAAGVLFFARSVFGDGASLVRNADFALDDFGQLRAWVLRHPGDAAEPLPGGGPDGATALRLRLDKGRQLYQPGIVLVADEPYRLSFWVKTSGYPKDGVQALVRNPRWNRKGPSVSLPGDTQGEWRRVEVSGVVPQIEEAHYYVAFYVAKPTAGATLEIARPTLEALSAKGREGSRAAVGGSVVRARIVPVDPLLSELDAADAAMTYSFDGVLPAPVGTYRLESSLDGGDWVGAALPSSRRVRLSHGAVAPGPHSLNVRLVAADGSVWRTNGYAAVARVRGRYPAGRRLNNFVSELLAVPLADGDFSFVVPAKGYVYFDLGVKDPTTEVRLDGVDHPLIAPNRGARSEAVRMLEEGPHRLTVRGVTERGLTLRVHAVRPVPHHGNGLGAARSDVRRYVYARDFYDRFLPMFYTEIGAPRGPKAPAGLQAWAAKSGAALASEFDFTSASRSSPEIALAKIRENGAFDEGLDVWLDELGVVHPRDDHINLGETLWRLQRKNAINVWWADAIRAWFTDSATHTAEIAGTVNSGDGRGSLYAEVYPGMLPTEEATYAQETNFIRFANSAAALVPAASNRTVFCFSGYIAPEGWNTYPAPEADYKVFFDHFMHRLATDPAFAGAGGIGSTAFHHIDEEQFRWIARIIRHYALEGRTDPLAARHGWKYLPGHVRNGDFADGLKDWTVEAAEPGSVVAAEKKDYGFKVQFRREVPSGYGDRVARLTRSARGPNRLSQTLTGLKPGALYVLSYHSTDEADVDSPGRPCRDFVLRATFEGAETLPRLSFNRLWPEDLNDVGRRAARPRDLKTHPLACTHRYVFRAKGPTAKLTLSDWACDTTPGAPVGRTRLLNYLSVRPYYVESEAQRAELEAYLSPRPETDDAGGVSFDFAALSEARHPASALGPDILPAGEWRRDETRVWLRPEELAYDSPVRARVRASAGVVVRKEGVWTTLEHGGTLTADAGSEKTSSLVGTRLERTVAFDGLPGAYEVGALYRHVSRLCHGSRVTGLTFEALDAKGKTLSSAHAALDKTGRETRLRQPVSVPQGTAKVHLRWELNGLGVLSFRDVTLRRAASAASVPKTPIVIRNTVPDCLDGTFCVSEGQCGVMSFEWKEGTLSGSQVDLSKLRFHFELPACVELAAGRSIDRTCSTFVQRPDRGTSVRIALKESPKPTKAFNRYGRPFLYMLKAKEAAGACGEGSLVVECDGKPVSNRERFRFLILPRITAVAPKRFLPGFIAGTDFINYHEAGPEDEMASFVGECGVRWIVRWADKRLRDSLHAHGVKYVSTISEEFRDGYVVGPQTGIPESDRFVPDAGLEKRRPFCNSVCPISVYEESEHFRKVSLPLLKKTVEGYDGLWVNWELWEYGKHGCFCDRCRAAFARFCGVGEETVKPLWPDQMKVDGEWGDRYARFRSEEGAKVVRTLDRYVRSFCRDGAASPGFMAGIAFMQATSWREDLMAKGVVARGFSEADIGNWLRDVKVLHGWGPYPWWKTSSPWGVGRAGEGGGELGYFVAAKDIRACMDRRYGRGRHMLMGAPQGYQGDANVTQPESIALALDSYLFNGWDAATVYMFPRGYDARYWRAFARAATRAARYEDAVYDGRRVDDAVTLTPQRDYPAPVPLPVADIVSATDVPMLQHAAYDYRGVRHVAALNFSWNTPAEVELKTDFAGGRYAIVDEDGRTWPKDGLLRVPAARTRVFELRPLP